MSITQPTSSYIPYYSQRVGERWREMGYPTKRIGAYWESRSCGVACTMMVVEGITGKCIPNRFYLTLRLLALGAYIPNKGWVHKRLASFLEWNSVKAHTTLLTKKSELVDCIEMGAILIASVGVGLEGNSKTGHLIVVIGMTDDNEIVIHHPSSEAAYEWANKPIPLDIFWNHFSGNVIVCTK